MRVTVRALIAVVLMMGAFSGCGPSGGSHALKPGTPAPMTKLVMLSGESRLLEEFYGTPTVVLFWASTCSASRSLIEDLNEYAAQSTGRARFVAVAIDKSIESVQSRIKGRNLSSLEHSFSGNDAYDEAFVRFGLDSVPYLYVLDESGMIIAAGDDLDVVEDVLG